MKEQKIIGLVSHGQWQINPEAWRPSNYELETLLGDLRDHVSTDEIYTPEACLYYQSNDVGRFTLAGDSAGFIKEGFFQEKRFTIVVAGENFGCGSAREHAGHTFKENGVKLILASSFDSTFRTNCIHLGILTSTNLSLLEKIIQTGEIPQDEILAEFRGVKREILEAGGVFTHTMERVTGKRIMPEIETGPRPMTAAEKIIAQHLPKASGQEVWVKPGDQVSPSLDWRMSYELFTPLMEKMLSKYAPGLPIEDPASIVLFADHVVASQDPQACQLLNAQQKFAQSHELTLHKHQDTQALGIGHNLMIEHYLLPGQLGSGTDSHSGIWGVLNSLGIPVGATAMANAFLTKDILIDLPSSVKIKLEGELPENCSAQDVALYLTVNLPSKEVGGTIFEFDTERLDWSVDNLSVLSCMAKEAGAITTIMVPNEKTIQFLMQQRGLNREEVEKMIVRSDLEAEYAATYTIDLRQIQPMVALPGSPRNAIPIRDLSKGIKIQKAFIGSCVGGKFEDLYRAAQVLKGRKVAQGVQLVIQPSTKAIFQRAEREKIITIFEEAGALLFPPNCGACFGQGIGRAETGETSISTATRNYPSRGGPGKVYLASPETVAASAIAGEIRTKQESKR